MANINDLKFVRTYDFRHIPRYLCDQTKELDKETIDRLYGFGGIMFKSPLTLLYVLLDEINVIKGVLWAEVSIIDAAIYVYLLSVDKEYQSNGQLISEAADFLLNIETGPEIKKELRFQTIHPDAYEKVGARRSKRILMEISHDTNNTKRDNESDTGTTE